MFVSCVQKRRHYFAALRLREINQSRTKAQSSQLNLRINSIGDVPSPEIELIYYLLKTSVESVGPRPPSVCTTAVRTLPSPDSDSFCVVVFTRSPWSVVKLAFRDVSKHWRYQ